MYGRELARGELAVEEDLLGYQAIEIIVRERVPGLPADVDRERCRRRSAHARCRRYLRSVLIENGDSRRAAVVERYDVAAVRCRAACRSPEAVDVISPLRARAVRGSEEITG